MTTHFLVTPSQELNYFHFSRAELDLNFDMVTYYLRFERQNDIKNVRLIPAIKFKNLMKRFC